MGTNHVTNRQGHQKSAIDEYVDILQTILGLHQNGIIIQIKFDWKYFFRHNLWPVSGARESAFQKI